MSYICMYLYNYLFIIPSVHIFIIIYVQKVLIGISWWYIAMYLHMCVRTLVLKIKWTSLLFYMKSRRYDIISIVIFGRKKNTWRKFIFSLLNFLKVKPNVSTCNVTGQILLYNTTHQLTNINSNNKLNRIDTKINESRNLCAWCGVCASVTHSLAKLLSDCGIERRFWTT